MNQKLIYIVYNWWKHHSLDLVLGVLVILILLNTVKVENIDLQNRDKYWKDVIEKECINGKNILKSFNNTLGVEENENKIYFNYTNWTSKENK